MAKEEKCDCNCNNSFGVASVILGLIGLVLGFAVFPIILSIIGLIFGIIQVKKSKNNWAIWGIILSVLGILISILVIWSIASFISQFEQTIAACQSNPSLPGCEQIIQMLSSAGA